MSTISKFSWKRTEGIGLILSSLGIALILQIPPTFFTLHLLEFNLEIDFLTMTGVIFGTMILISAISCSLTEDWDNKKSPTLRSTVTASFLLSIIFIIGFCLVMIPAGHVGVKYSWSGGVQDEEFGEGWHLKPPWISVTKYSTQIIQKTETMHTLSKEGLSVNMDATILYHISPDKANEIHQGIKQPYDSEFIMPQLRSVIREVIAEYDAMDIYSEKRSVIEQNVFDEVKKRLDKKGIIVESILFRNVELPPQLKTAIEEKKKAEQESLRMEYILKKEEQEAGFIKNYYCGPTMR